MLEEDKELYEMINELNKELDEVLEILAEPIKKGKKKRKNDEKIIIPEFGKKRDNCCC